MRCCLDVGLLTAAAPAASLQPPRPADGLFYVDLALPLAADARKAAGEQPGAQWNLLQARPLFLRLRAPCPCFLALLLLLCVAAGPSRPLY